MRTRYLAAAVAGVAVGALVVLLLVDHDDRAREINVRSASSAAPAKADDAVVSYSVSLAPDAAKSSRILKVKKMGTFSARCENGRVHIKFVAGSIQTVLITAAP